MKNLIILVPSILSIFINILCMMGKVDLTIVGVGGKVTTVAMFIYEIINSWKRRRLQTDQIYNREKNSLKKTIEESTIICVILTWFITMFVALIVGCNR